MPAAVPFILAAAFVFLIVGITTAALALRSRVMPGPSLVAKTVVIHTKRPDDQSIRGVLVAQHADRFTLREAIYLHSGGEQEVGGLVHVPIEAVAFLQEIE